jgi:alpha-galactosidase
LIPGLAKAATLTTRVVNHGRSAANQIDVSVQAPKGWTIQPVTAAAGPSLETDAALETRWNVLVPENTPAGHHPLAVKASFTWSAASTKAASASEVMSVVAVAPPKGDTPLSTLVPVSASNGLGPVEIDASNGGEAEDDGNLISIGGKLYTRGLGTHAPSSVSYHLGGRCASLSVDVGVDDEVGADGSVAFEVHADGKIVAQSGVLTGKDPARTLTADLKGVQQLELVTLSGDAPLGDHADWAVPRIVCGGSTAPSVVERTLFSFESGTEEFTIANAGAGGTFAVSKQFATDGVAGLEVTSPADGNWFGRRFSKPMDLSAFKRLRYDVKTGSAGTVGEFALQVGPSSSWCQGGQWSWVNPSSSKTIERAFTEISCPAGVTLDRKQVHAIWVFVKAATVQIDNVRAE